MHSDGFALDWLHLTQARDPTSFDELTCERRRLKLYLLCRHAALVPLHLNDHSSCCSARQASLHEEACGGAAPKSVEPATALGADSAIPSSTSSSSSVAARSRHWISAVGSFAHSNPYLSDEKSVTGCGDGDESSSDTMVPDPAEAEADGWAEVDDEEGVAVTSVRVVRRMVGTARA